MNAFSSIAERCLDLFGISFALGGIGQSLFRGLDGVIPVVLVARKNMKMEVKCVLVSRRFIVLPCCYAITLVDFFHGQRDFLGDIKDSMAIFCRQSIDALKMLIRNKDDVAGVFAYKERIDKAGYKIVLIDNITRLHESIRALFALNAKTNGTNIIFGGVTFDHKIIILQYKPTSRHRQSSVDLSLPSNDRTNLETQFGK